MWCGAVLSGQDAVGCLRVEVTDSGVGLTAEEQSNLFGEFTQFNKNELQAGGIQWMNE